LQLGASRGCNDLSRATAIGIAQRQTQFVSLTGLKKQRAGRPVIQIERRAVDDEGRVGTHGGGRRVPAAFTHTAILQRERTVVIVIAGDRPRDADVLERGVRADLTGNDGIGRSRAQRAPRCTQEKDGQNDTCHNHTAAFHDPS
jgi:hypothetical protein